MCTVTYLPIDIDSFVLTSNRDESPERKTIAPEVYRIDGVRVLFPKDQAAGGTWFGVSDRNRAVCVLNGAYHKHIRKPNYSKSRGLIALDLLTAVDLNEAIQNLDLWNVEPFTMIVVSFSEGIQALEMIWDGRKKLINSLGDKPRIWSSSTLYDDDMKNERKAWFAEFLMNKQFSPDELFQFHSSKKTDSNDYDLIMNRGHVRTTSISQLILNEDGIEMRYEDLIKSQTIRRKLTTEISDHG